MKKKPVIFGDKAQQQLLLDMFMHGSVPRVGIKVTRLLSSGLAVEFTEGKKRRQCLDPRHPFYRGLCAVLGELSGTKQQPNSRTFTGEHVVNPERPFGHYKYVPFRLMSTLVANGELTVDELVGRVPDIWHESVKTAVDKLVDDGVFRRRERNQISLSPSLPTAFAKLVTSVASYLAKDDERFVPRTTAVQKRVGAYVRNEDGAARLFGMDVRLRLLMTLAKYGRMNVLDLRRCIGGDVVKLDPKTQAPFTRTGIVRTWIVDDQTYAMLDPECPLYLPLRTLLVKLEEHYPVLPFKPAYAIPTEPPKVGKWEGDRHFLFGSDIPTAILTSIAPMGWTFEALCCAVATGFHRENVKKAMMRLEDDGIIQGDRPRKPGFNVRVVTISDTFPAKAELEALLQACLTTWPQIGKTVAVEMTNLAPRTKAQLRKRGLV